MAFHSWVFRCWVFRRWAFCRWVFRSNMDVIPTTYYVIRWHSIVEYSVVGYSGQTWTEYPLHIISYMIRWHSIVGYSVVGHSVVGYSRRWVFPMLGIPYSYRWQSTVGYSVVGYSIVGYSGHFARNTQRPKYPTFLLGILVVGYSRRWVFRTVTPQTSGKVLKRYNN